MTISNGWKPGDAGDPEDKRLETLDELWEAASEIGDIELEHDAWGDKKNGARPCKAKVSHKNGKSGVTSRGEGETAAEALKNAYFEARRMRASPPLG